MHALLPLMAALSGAPAGDPVAAWPLAVDARDASGHGLDCVAAGVAFSEGSALFNGRGTHMACPDFPAEVFGSGDFSLALWVHTEAVLDDTLGDLISKFDPDARRGFHLGIINYSGVTSAQPNYRNLCFGVDWGDEPSGWTDCGRPGNSVFITSLASHDRYLYAGICEAGAEERGHVYRYAGEAAWVDCGSPDASNAVFALAVHDGALYAGTARYRLRGSALPDSPNQEVGGSVFRYEGGKQWMDCGRLGESDAVIAMAVYNGALYATPAYHKGVYRYDGGTDWVSCGVPGDTPGPMFGENDGPADSAGCRLISLAVFDGSLYGAGNGRGQGIFRYEGGTEWTNVGVPEGVDQVYSFMQYGGKLYTGTWPNAEVFRWEGGDTWTSCGQLGGEMEVMGMATYNGKLYGGSLPLAKVFRLDGADTWIDMGRLDMTPDVRYRRAWSMCVHGGKLFCGLLPSGRVCAFRVGECVTVDRELAPGWRHVAAVRDGDTLKLYVDGALAAASADGRAAGRDISCAAPLRIGAGPQDFLNGRLRDVRVFSRALGAEEIGKLAR